MEFIFGAQISSYFSNWERQDLQKPMKRMKIVYKTWCTIRLIFVFLLVICKSYGN